MSYNISHVLNSEDFQAAYQSVDYEDYYAQYLSDQCPYFDQNMDYVQNNVEDVQKGQKAEELNEDELMLRREQIQIQLTSEGEQRQTDWPRESQFEKQWNETAQRHNQFKINRKMELPLTPKVRQPILFQNTEILQYVNNLLPNPLFNPKKYVQKNKKQLFQEISQRYKQTLERQGGRKKLGSEINKKGKLVNFSEIIIVKLFKKDQKPTNSGQRESFQEYINSEQKKSQSKQQINFQDNNFPNQQPFNIHKHLLFNDVIKQISNNPFPASKQKHSFPLNFFLPKEQKNISIFSSDNIKYLDIDEKDIIRSAESISNQINAGQEVDQDQSNDHRNQMGNIEDYLNINRIIDDDENQKTSQQKQYIQQQLLLFEDDTLNGTQD